MEINKSQTTIVYCKYSYKFLLGSRNKGTIIHAIKEFHRPDLFTFTDRLNFVFGFGVHTGYE